jgi:hypothetical protein
VASGLKRARGVQEVPAQSGRFGRVLTLGCELTSRVAPRADHVRQPDQAVFQPVEGLFDMSDGHRAGRHRRRITGVLLEPTGGALQFMSHLL